MDAQTCGGRGTKRNALYPPRQTRSKPTPLFLTSSLSRPTRSIRPPSIMGDGGLAPGISMLMDSLAARKRRHLQCRPRSYGSEQYYNPLRHPAPDITIAISKAIYLGLHVVQYVNTDSPHCVNSRGCIAMRLWIVPYACLFILLRV
jgi:hypothetical protein